MSTNTIQGRYEDLDSRRSSVLNRAYDCAELTLPSILPRDGHSEDTELPTPYQSLGARGVNNLASKLLLALLPPNAAFFRFAMDEQTLMELTGDPEMKAEVESALARVERTIMTHIETSSIRPVLFEALKHLLVTGNVMVALPKKGGSRLFRLDHYVVRRDPAGNILEVITKESVSPHTLSEKVCSECGVDPSDEKYENVDIYTQYKRVGKFIHISQEINEMSVSGSYGKVPLDEAPFIVLRYSTVASENYGRGIIEEYLGDLRSLEGLTKSIVIAAAASAKVLFMVEPNATTRQKDLEKPSGDVIVGSEKDVSVLQVQKHADLRVARELVNDINQRLAQAFLMTASIQRNAERVTAEEIRIMAQELEDALGGVYSILSQEFQLPYVKREMARLRSRGVLPDLPKEMVKPMITTGLEALGRGHDIAKLRALLEDIIPLGQETIAMYLNIADYITRASTARGVDTDGLIRTEDQVKQIQQQQQMAAMAQQAAPGMLQEAMKQSGGNNG